MLWPAWQEEPEKDAEEGAIFEEMALEEEAVEEEGLCIAALWDIALALADEEARHYLLGDG